MFDCSNLSSEDPDRLHIQWYIPQEEQVQFQKFKDPVEARRGLALAGCQEQAAECNGGILYLAKQETEEGDEEQESLQEEVIAEQIEQRIHHLQQDEGQLS